MKEQVKEFWRKIDQDEVLKQRFTEAGSKDEFEGVVKDTGLAFTREEYQQAVKEMQQEAGIEKLTDDDLHKVTGGDACDPNFTICQPNATPCEPQCAPCAPHCLPSNVPYRPPNICQPGQK